MLIVFKQGLLLMYVLLLSIFMAVVINSVCVKRSQIQNKEVILVYVFAGNSLWHHWELFAPLWETWLPQFVLCQMLCFTIPFETVLLTDESLEFMDLNFEVNRKVCSHLGSSGLFFKVVKKFAIFKAYYYGSNFNSFFCVTCQISFSCTDTNIISLLFLALDLQNLFDEFRIYLS